MLVENYYYDHSLWSSDRMGIFGSVPVLDTNSSFHHYLSFTDDCEEEIKVDELLSAQLNTLADYLFNLANDREQ